MGLIPAYQERPRRIFRITSIRADRHHVVLTRLRPLRPLYLGSRSVEPIRATGCVHGIILGLTGLSPSF